jgi:hypothetical protein
MSRSDSLFIGVGQPRVWSIKGHQEIFPQEGAGRALLYMVVFLQIESVVPPFIAATEQADSLQNVVRVAANAMQGAAHMSSVAVHVLTPAPHRYENYPHAMRSGLH